jgi:hypothetical protein
MAVYFWSGNGFQRGVASALEAPVMPPSLNSPEVVAPPVSQGQKAKENKISQAEEKTKKTSDEVIKVKENLKQPQSQKVEKVASDKAKSTEVDKVSSQEIGLQKPDQMLEDYSENKVVATAAPLEPVATEEVRVKEVKKEQAEIKQNKTEKPAKAVETPQKSVVESSEVKKIESAKEERPRAAKAPVSKTEKEEKKPVKVIKPIKKSIKKATKVVSSVPTEVPPEWNWFEAPLKVDMVAGKVQISSDMKAVKPSVSVHRKVEDTRPVKAVKSTATVAKKIKRQEEKPFAKALARMAKLKAKRKTDGKARLQMLKASQKPIEKVSPALKRLNDLLKKLKTRDKRINMTQKLYEMHASSKANQSSDSNSKSSIDFAGKAGNDSSACTNSIEGNKDSSEECVSGGFSMRMREFVSSGAWLSSR